MQLHVMDRPDGVTQVALVGELDVKGLHEIDMAFHAQTAARHRPTIVDVSGLTFISSLGMGMFVACAQSLSRRGAGMVLLNPQPLVEKALRTSRIELVIPIAHTLEDAEAMLKAERV